MPNQHTIKKPANPDQIFPHVAVGQSNEELLKKQEELDEKKARGEYVNVSVLADAHDKQTDGFGDTDYDPLGLTDPLAQLKKDFQRPGMALKLLSDDVNHRLGRRGYQIVKDENGDPVRCGKMVLGEIPEKLAAQRRRAPIRRSNEEIGSIQDAQRDTIEKMKTDARGMGLTILEPGDTVKNHGDGQNYDMGLTVERGEQ